MSAHLIRQIFYLILGLAYVVAGLFIYLKKILPSPWGLVVLILFSLYGAWRIYRGFRVKT